MRGKNELELRIKKRIQSIGCLYKLLIGLVLWTLEIGGVVLFFSYGKKMNFTSFAGYSILSLLIILAGISLYFSDIALQEKGDEKGGCGAVSYAYFLFAIGILMFVLGIIALITGQ
jgi:hypothetical protein